MNLAEIIEMYEADVIPTKGKSELISAFLQEFCYKSATSWRRIIYREAMPTPAELDWMVKNVGNYYNHYLLLQEAPETSNA